MGIQKGVVLRLLELVVSSMDSPSVSVPEGLVNALASLRSLYMIQQQNHWECRGPNFYGNHQLFARLYDTASKDADDLAERLIGLYGTDAIPMTALLPKVAEFVGALCNNAQLPQIVCGVQSEHAVLKVLEAAVELPGLSKGLDDLLRTQCGNREQGIYLLTSAS